MTMMTRETAGSMDHELEYVGAIDDCSHSFMVSYRNWETFISYGPHFHRFYEIIIHHKNGGRFVIGRDAYEMQPNTFYVVAPHQLHDIVSDGYLHGYERICIYATESMLSMAGMSLVPILEMMNNASIARQNGFSLTDQEYDEIYELTGKMHRKLVPESISSSEELEDRLHFMLVLTILSRAMERGKVGAAQGHISPLILQLSTTSATTTWIPSPWTA